MAAVHHPSDAALRELPIIALDGQSSGHAPPAAQLIELAWLATSAARWPDHQARHHRLRLPPDGTLPTPIARLTGLSTEDLRAPSASDAEADALAAWAALLADVRAQGGLTVIHFARFEAPFLRALHAQVSGEPFPLRLVCSHELARRLLPDLPRHGLRAVAGYLGATLGPLRHAPDQALATAALWAALVPRLAAAGIETLAALELLLLQPPPPRGRGRDVPLPASMRLGLPETPGVYRFVRRDGSVLYVGKARSLRQRVNSYYRQRRPHASVLAEMLTQAHGLDCTPTVTELEASLLEHDEIKRLAPPYNQALQAAGRRLWWAAPDCRSLAPCPDAHHRLGPLASPDPILLLGWLAAGPGPLPPLGAYAPPSDMLHAGAELAAAVLAEQGAPGPALHRWRLLAARLWHQRQPEQEEEEARPPGETELTARAPASDEPLGEPGRVAPDWDPALAAAWLLGTITQAGLQLRRAAWLRQLSESVICWRPAEAGWPGRTRRFIILSRGALVVAGDLAPGARAPLPPSLRWRAGQRQVLDLASYDRMRVLTTALRRLVAVERAVSVRVRPRGLLERTALRRLLAWL